jgi:hypothetical protein
VLQYGDLPPRQSNRSVAHLRVAAERVEGDVAGLENGAKCAAGASSKGFDPSDELSSRERLYQIVVRSCIETADAVFDGISGGQEEDRRFVCR